MITTEQSSTAIDPSSYLEDGSVVRSNPPDPERQITWHRLRGASTVVALTASAIGALGVVLGTVVAGRLAEDPTEALVWLLALCVVGAAVLDTVGRTIWAAICDRAEGTLRADLLSAALHQPLAQLSEQAVGEVLDRVDDDTWEVGSLVRRQVWEVLRTVFATLPMWIVAGLTWWPAWILFPAFGVAAVAVVRPLLPEIATRKIEEEIAWTDHAAALEEGIAGRDDLRTSLGQAHVVRRLAQLSARVHELFDRVLVLEVQVTRRAGVLLHALLAGVAVSGVALVMSDNLSVARLVTLFLVTSTFVGQINHLTQWLPDLQAGLGAIMRLRQLLETVPEPKGGLPLPEGPLSLELRDLHFSYEQGTFALHEVDLMVPAGRTCALVGRTGSGKSTLASLVSRAVEPERGSVLLGGVDVLDLDLQQLRAAVGVVTQRTEILAGTLAENIALFADLPRERVEDAVSELGLDSWAAGLPEGLDTLLGPGGTTLSAGEAQLVSFARLLVRDVSVVVLDEATARMDPLTEALVVRAADRLLTGRTGVLIAHRLSTTARADTVAVLEAGTVIQQGPRATLVVVDGPFRTLLQASVDVERLDDSGEQEPDPRADGAEITQVGGTRRTGPAPAVPEAAPSSSLSRGIVKSLLIHPSWGLLSVAFFVATSLVGAFGAITGFVWGRLVEDLKAGGEPWGYAVALVVCLLAAPFVLASAIRRYPRWWIAVMLRVRTAVLTGQTEQHRLGRTP
ncbi:ABC transporter ATP-binding protein, partial [Nocardioides sp.]|uniref:ABC transporter ATP-binding protein n=1 Tax=Nocardioides sp. TaxID=35761 RepID=UPI002B268D80